MTFLVFLSLGQTIQKTQVAHISCSPKVQGECPVDIRASPCVGDWWGISPVVTTTSDGRWASMCDAIYRVGNCCEANHCLDSYIFTSAMLVKTINLKDSKGKGYLFRGPHYTDYDGRKVKPHILHRTSDPDEVWRIAEHDLEATMQETLADPDLVHYATDLKDKIYYMRIYDGFVFVLYIIRTGNMIGRKRYATHQSLEMDDDIFAKQYSLTNPKQEDEEKDSEFCPLYENKERLMAFLEEHHVEID